MLAKKNKINYKICLLPLSRNNSHIFRKILDHKFKLNIQKMASNFSNYFMKMVILPILLILSFYKISHASVTWIDGVTTGTSPGVKDNDSISTIASPHSGLRDLEYTGEGSGPILEKRSIGSLSALKFDGTDESSYNIDDGGASLEGDYTIFIVDKPDSTVEENRQIINCNVGRVFRLGDSKDSRVSVLQNCDGDRLYYQNNEPVTSDDGFSVPDGTNAEAIENCKIGGQYKGHIGELIIIPKCLKANDVRDAVSYLSGKWAIKRSKGATAVQYGAAEADDSAAASANAPLAFDPASGISNPMLINSSADIVFAGNVSLLDNGSDGGGSSGSTDCISSLAVTGGSGTFTCTISGSKVNISYSGLEYDTTYDGTLDVSGFCGPDNDDGSQNCAAGSDKSFSITTVEEIEIESVKVDGTTISPDGSGDYAVTDLDREGATIEIKFNQDVTVDVANDAIDVDNNFSPATDVDAQGADSILITYGHLAAAATTYTINIATTAANHIGDDTSVLSAAATITLTSKAQCSTETQSDFHEVGDTYGNTWKRYQGLITAYAAGSDVSGSPNNTCATEDWSVKSVFGVLTRYDGTGCAGCWWCTCYNYEEKFHRYEGQFICGDQGQWVKSEELIVDPGNDEICGRWTKTQQDADNYATSATRGQAIIDDEVLDDYVDSNDPDHANYDCTVEAGGIGSCPADTS